MIFGESTNRLENLAILFCRAFNCAPFVCLFLFRLRFKTVHSGSPVAFAVLGQEMDDMTPLIQIFLKIFPKKLLIFIEGRQINSKECFVNSHSTFAAILSLLRERRKGMSENRRGLKGLTISSFIFLFYSITEKLQHIAT